MLLNGRYLTFDQPPINRNGRVLVPMRAIFEALGADVDWDNNLRRAIGTLGARQVQLTIDSKTAYINGEPVELDVPAVIESSRTLVPVRVVSEGLDAKVDWDGITNTVIIV
ncbi:MAG TPA: copper amine oxidase, partial [Clostridiales bacterium UBA9856]|nr:copper amine oxidase [Clostridiales bacterium UBA9856]